MPRNFLRRIEVAFPIIDPALRDRVINEVLPNFLTDRVKARELQPDGSYRRLKPEGTEPRVQAQWQFREKSRQRLQAPKSKRQRGPRLIPISTTDSRNRESEKILVIDIGEIQRGRLMISTREAAEIPFRFETHAAAIHREDENGRRGLEIRRDRDWFSGAGN